MSQIVCLAGTPWGDYTGRSRQLMGRMGRHRILYFDPPPENARRGGVRETTHKDEGRQVAKWITCYATPPTRREALWPLRAAAHRLMSSNIKGRMSEVGFTSPVLWIGSPLWTPYVKDIPHGLVIFDCPPPCASWSRNDLERCAELSDVVFCRSPEELERLASHCKSAFVLRDGADFELFNTASGDELPFPDALFNVKNPILGLVGDIDSRLELGFIEKAAKERPDWSFALIGRKDENSDLSCIEGLKNVRFMGYVEQRQLPHFISRFDACLYLERSGSEGRGIRRGVLYEYLASGKPIVGTPGALLEYSDVAYIAGTPQEFIEQCKRAVGERDAWKVRQRITYGRAASWDARVLEIERAIRDKGETV